MIHFFFRPPIFRDHPYTRWAFEFWVIRWFMFLFTFIVIALYKQADTRLLLALVDLGSVAGLGFFWAYLADGTFVAETTLTDLGLSYGLLLAWNLFFSHNASTLWIGASLTVSAASLSLFAYVFLLRYGGPGVPIALIALGYLVIQRPAYEKVFLHHPIDPSWMYALAIGKLLLGAVFYAMYFLPPARSGALPILSIGPSTNEKLQKALRWLLAILAGKIVDSLATRVAGYLARTFSH